MGIKGVTNISGELKWKLGNIRMLKTFFAGEQLYISNWNVDSIKSSIRLFQYFWSSQFRSLILEKFIIENYCIKLSMMSPNIFTDDKSSQLWPAIVSVLCFLQYYHQSGGSILMSRSGINSCQLSAPTVVAPIPASQL